MKAGDIVRINEPAASYHGNECEIIAVNTKKVFPYLVMTSWGAFWFPAIDLEVPQPTDNKHPADFSHSGLSIGGLGRHVEPVTVPTIAALKRYERQAARATTCRQCRQSDVFDGAMFTTDPASGLCDDCV